MATCGEVLVTLLEARGVEFIFGIPGVHTVELYRGLAASRIRHVTPRHEQGAGFMADGYARTTGKPGVCFIITGPGMTNIATAMGQAYADSVPMLVISSVNRRAELGSGDGRLHELPSQRGLFAGLTAFSHTLQTPDELPQVLDRAFALFASGRPRPVHIEIPIDVLVLPADHLRRTPAAAPSRPGPCPRAIAEAAQLLAAARAPVVLVGGGACDAADAVQRLVARLDAPTALTINAKGVLPPAHPLNLGSNQSLPPVRELVAAADVVLALGTELGETDYDVVFDGGFRIGGALIRVDLDPEQLVRNHPPRLAITSDAGLAVEALNAALGADNPVAAADGAGARRAAAVRERLEAGWSPLQRAQRTLLDTIRAELPGVIFVGDSTQPVYGGNHVYDAEQPRSWFNASTGYGTLGYGLPAALGAKLGAGARPVVALVGDGGVQFTLPELTAAVEANIPVVVLLWNNAGYGEIRRYMVDRAITPIGVELYTPDFQTLARGFGCAAERVDSWAGLRAALRAAAARTVPTLVEVDEAAPFLHGAA
ncbi:acetolactate synthase-1/2/3 large subunit [Plasticicumulans lactativorans]|uniref:Acetolactate synthase-1/2/3 large subunit n=1 Tax=Plasticicumulans lactativorans TaxID=1133106 RepID=A0A4R2L8U6_9GAMM|nr:5-guanidino-2-oxopentanoate decarboxylase [Plasticicumulans lactativorans]TCO81736.1 acetolactate synthase-1/2/3 large subunit [Plasticicumulans lactativorans]